MMKPPTNEKDRIKVATYGRFCCVLLFLSGAYRFLWEKDERIYGSIERFLITFLTREQIGYFFLFLSALFMIGIILNLTRNDK